MLSSLKTTLAFISQCEPHSVTLSTLGLTPLHTGYRALTASLLSRGYVLYFVKTLTEQLRVIVNTLVFDSAYQTIFGS